MWGAGQSFNQPEKHNPATSPFKLTRAGHPAWPSRYSSASGGRPSLFSLIIHWLFTFHKCCMHLLWNSAEKRDAAWEAFSQSLQCSQSVSATCDRWHNAASIVICRLHKALHWKSCLQPDSVKCDILWQNTKLCTGKDAYRQIQWNVTLYAYRQIQWSVTVYDYTQIQWSKTLYAYRRIQCDATDDETQQKVLH